MRRNHPASAARALCGFPIEAGLLLTVLLFFLTLSPAIAETATITPADIEQLFKDKQFLQVLSVLETWKQTLPDGLSERRRLLLLGRCLLGLERHSEAIEALGSMQAIAPEAKDDAAVDAGNFLGDALAGLGRLDEAAGQWLKTAEIKTAVAMEALVRQKASNYSRNRI